MYLEGSRTNKSKAEHFQRYLWCEKAETRESDNFITTGKSLINRDPVVTCKGTEDTGGLQS